MGPNPFNHQVGNTIYGLKIVGASQTIHPINTATGEFHSSISLALNAAQGFYPNNVVAAAYVFKLQGSDSNVQDLVPISFENAGGNNPRYVSFHNPAQVGSKCDNENPEY